MSLSTPPMLDDRGIGRIYDNFRFLPRLIFFSGMCRGCFPTRVRLKRKEFISPSTMLVAIPSTKILHMWFLNFLSPSKCGVQLIYVMRLIKKYWKPIQQLKPFSCYCSSWTWIMLIEWLSFWSIWKHKVRQDVNELSSRVVEMTHWSMEDSLAANTTTNICRLVHSKP